MLISSFFKLISSLHLCPDLVPSFKMMDEKGIRCKSGAIPVAVSPLPMMGGCNSVFFKPLFARCGWEGETEG